MVQDLAKLLFKIQRPAINKIYLYVEDPFESKYQLLINRKEKVGIKKLRNQKHLLIIHEQLMMSTKI